VSQQSAVNAQRILIVDDSPYNLFVMQEILGTLEHTH